MEALLEGSRINLCRLDPALRSNLFPAIQALRDNETLLRSGANRATGIPVDVEFSLETDGTVDNIFIPSQGIVSDHYLEVLRIFRNSEFQPYTHPWMGPLPVDCVRTRLNFHPSVLQSQATASTAEIDCRC